MIYNKDNIKQKELSLWNDYKSGNPSVLPSLMKSFDPVIQTNVNKFSGAPLPRIAMESEARRLAVTAFDTYDPSKGAGLSTHLTNHLKHLQRYVIQYQNVGKIPEHRGIAISRFQNLKDNLEQDLNRPPTTFELGDALGWSPSEVERMELELRQDLTISTGKEDATQFFDASFYVADKTKEIMHFIYYDPTTSPVEKKLLEYKFGFGGSSILGMAEIAVKLKMTESQLREAGAALALKIRKNEQYF
jgi:DNA-directed RNA polymerase sigma subunit (sigma70/sigma32)